MRDMKDIDVVAAVLRVIKSSTTDSASKLLIEIEVKIPHATRKQIIDAINVITGDEVLDCAE